MGRDDICARTPYMVRRREKFLLHFSFIFFVIVDRCRLVRNSSEMQFQRAKILWGRGERATWVSRSDSVVEMRSFHVPPDRLHCIFFKGVTVTLFERDYDLRFGERNGTNYISISVSLGNNPTNRIRRQGLLSESMSNDSSDWPLEFRIYINYKLLLTFYTALAFFQRRQTFSQTRIALMMRSHMYILVLHICLHIHWISIKY